ncbi:Protein kinase domain-containing protein [Mycena sanguinolenta]|uniref:Protein kinase domain-containing protein n=1 Tax=Mycena sanguinolenta TaxID=230812 RepID=A0A8H6XIM0_9AGAR|nr:Protein kinase domain-containing protein [Mycena sanguinolenta]
MDTPELSAAVVQRIVHHVYLSCVSDLGCKQHFCSPVAPCRLAVDFLGPFLTLKLVASLWNTAVKTYKLDAFFSNVEEGVYYPHSWHINTRVRKAVLLSRYRVFRTIQAEAAHHGVYVAYDFGGPQGCAGASEVVIKAWTFDSEPEIEYHHEIEAYKILQGCPGVPETFGTAEYEPLCDVHALPMQKLGPTLEELTSLLPQRRFDARMVLTVAIQMIERYRDIHVRGLIHSGTKPANICLASRGAGTPGMLYVIDFGFSLPVADNLPLPSAHRIDVVGNRRFMSVLAHHGISKSQRDDLESLGYLLSYLFHGELPWDIPRITRLRSFRGFTNGEEGQKQQQAQQQPQQDQPQVWRLKMATPGSKLFRGMDECFHEFWRDVKSLGYGEIPDYEKMRSRFAMCLEEHEKSCAPRGWWDVWDQFSK